MESAPKGFEMQRIIAAFVFCTIGVPVLVSALDNWNVSIAFPALLVTAFGTLFLGLPMYRYYRHRGWLRLHQFVLGGGSLGLVISLLVLFDGGRATIQAGAIFVPMGAIHGLVFWIVGVWNNPIFTQHATVEAASAA